MKQDKRRKPVTITVKPLKVTTHDTERNGFNWIPGAFVLIALLNAANLLLWGKP